MKQHIQNTFRAFFLAGLLLLGVAANARTISGVVTDQTGESIISASVIVKGTSIGTVTDFDGNYTLDVPEDATTLVFSYIGLVTQEIEITSSIINVVLRENAEVLDEVVVTGYGVTKKRDLVTAVSSVSADQLKDIPVTSAGEALQGKLAGVSVTTTEGSPDADVKIRVRGGTSLTQSNDPLYIVDGFPVSSISDIAPSDIASMDVLKDAAATAIYGAQGANGVIIITTKDGDSSSDDKMTFHVDYTGYIGWKKLAKKYDVMNSEDFTLMQYEWAYLKDKDKLKSNFNAYFDALYNRTKHRDDEAQETTPISSIIQEYADPELHPASDWQDSTFGRWGFNSNQSISVTGGNKNANFNLSYNRIDDKAIMYMSNYVRNNLSLKAKFKPFKDFTVSFTARYSNTEVLGAGSNAVKDNGTSTESRLRNAVVYTPVKLLSKNAEGESSEDETIGNLADPLSAIRANYKLKTDNKWSMNGYASYKFAKHFTAKVELGYESRHIATDRYYGPITYFAKNTGRPGVAAGTAQLQVLNEYESRLRNANTLEWKQTFKKAHQVSVLVGEETIIHKSETETLNGFGYKGNYNEETGEIFNYLGQASYSEILNYIAPKDNQLSFFARANYDYKGRYYITGTFRADASTRFEKENQWGFFPSVAAAWRMSDEPFMENAQSWLSNLKFRLSYGMAGNNNVDLGFLHQDFLSRQMTYLDMGQGTSNILVVGGSDKIAPNPHLKWETTITRDFGIDYGFFNERLTGAIDLYWNNTRDLIILQKLPARYNAQYQNIGSTRNMGVEFSVKGVVLDRQSRNLSYNLTLDANLTYNQNRVMDLGNVTSLSAQTNCFGSSEYITLAEFLVEVGQPIGNVVGYQTDGYYTASDFVSYTSATDVWGLKDGVVKYPKEGFLDPQQVRPGAVKFKDISGPDGKPDGVIDKYDKVLLGNTVPVLTGGFGISGNVGGDKWGRIDFSANFTFAWGNKILNLNKMEYTTITEKSRMRNLITNVSFANRYSLFNEQGTYLPASQEYLNGKSSLVGKSYTAFAQKLDEYNAAKGANHASPIMSDYVVTDQCMEDGSFLRLQNLTIGYSLPKVWMQKTKVIQNIRVFAQGTNLFCATAYSGIDPEVDTRSSKNPLTPGVDFSAYPKSRGFNFGMNIQF